MAEVGLEPRTRRRYETEERSQILRELAEELCQTPTIAELRKRLAEDAGLAASVRVNTREDARLSFEHAVNDRIQDMVDVRFRFYKLLNDDPGFAGFFRDIMFDRYVESMPANQT